MRCKGGNYSALEQCPPVPTIEQPTTNSAHRSTIIRPLSSWACGKYSRHRVNINFKFLMSNRSSYVSNKSRIHSFPEIPRIASSACRAAAVPSPTSLRHHSPSPAAKDRFFNNLPDRSSGALTIAPCSRTKKARLADRRNELQNWLLAK